MKISITNPDPGLLADSEFYQYNQIGNDPAVLYRDPQSQTVKVKLEGEWQIDQPANDVIISFDGVYSTMEVETINGKTVQTLLKRIVASTNSVREKNSGKINVYPNPSSGQITVVFDDAQIRTVVVENMLGQLVKTLSANQQLNVIDLTGFSSGIYCIKVTQGNELPIGKFILK